MREGNVRNIESLERFHGQLIDLSKDWSITLAEVRALLHRARTHFEQDWPRHWRHQLKLAERELTEAQDNRLRAQSATRAGDRPAATEATGRVRSAQQRVRECQQKIQLARSIALEISSACDSVLGPLAEVAEHCEVVLPSAARQLRLMIEQLRNYADHPPPPNS